MSVSNGQPVEASVLNAAYVSKTTDSEIASVISLNNPSSGVEITNLQEAVNFNKDEAAANSLSIASNATDIVNLQNQIPNNNFSATSAPISTDDQDAGYIVGAMWININTDKIYQAVDVSPAAAIWKEIEIEKNNYEAIIDPVVTDDDSEGYSVGSKWINTDSAAIFFCIDATTGAAVWSQSGSGAGSGGLDTYHIETFEDFDIADLETGTGGWLAGGTEDGVFSIETTSPISGEASLKYVSGSSSTGDYAAMPAITLNLKQKDNQTYVTLYYTYDGNAEDIAFKFYDVTNTNELDNNLVLVEATTKATRKSATFHIPSTATTLRYGFQVTTGNSGAILLIDDIEFTTKPITDQSVANLTDWESYVPTSSGWSTFTNNQSRWKRVGGDVVLMINVDTASPQASEAQIGLPNGLVISSELTETMLVGYASGTNASDGTPINVLATAGDTFVNFGNAASGASSKLTPSTASNAFASPSTISFTVSIPIEGWLANNPAVVTAQEGADSEIMLITGDGYGSTNTVIRNYATESFNKGTAFTSTLSSTLGASITVNESGLYFISRKEYRNSGLANVGVSRNSTELTTVMESVVTDDVLLLGYGASSGLSATQSTTRYLNKGDVLRAHDNGNNNSTGVGQAFLYVAKMGFNSLSAIPVPKIAYIKDVKASGTAGGTLASGDVGGEWGNLRTLTTVRGPNPEIVSLSSNQFTLGKGQWTISWCTPAYDTNSNQSALYDVSVGEIVERGETAYSESSGNGFTKSCGEYTITLTAPKIFSIRHKVNTTSTTNGGGVAASFGEEIYTTVRIEGAITNRY